MRHPTASWEDSRQTSQHDHKADHREPADPYPLKTKNFRAV